MISLGRGGMHTDIGRFECTFTLPSCGAICNFAPVSYEFSTPRNSIATYAPEYDAVKKNQIKMSINIRFLKAYILL